MTSLHIFIHSGIHILWYPRLFLQGQRYKQLLIFADPHSDNDIDKRHTNERNFAGNSIFGMSNQSIVINCVANWQKKKKSRENVQFRNCISSFGFLNSVHIFIITNINLITHQIRTDNQREKALKLTWNSRKKKQIYIRSECIYKNHFSLLRQII